MTYTMKPLACEPTRIKGMSEQLIVSHYENNYGGAVRRLNAIAAQLAELDFATAPVFVVNGLKRGADRQQLDDPARALFRLAGHRERAGRRAARCAGPRFRHPRSLARGILGDGEGARRRVGMGAAHLVDARPQAPQSMGDGPHDDTRRRAAPPRARYVRALLSHRLRR